MNHSHGIFVLMRKQMSNLTLTGTIEKSNQTQNNSGAYNIERPRNATGENKNRQCKHLPITSYM